MAEMQRVAIWPADIRSAVTRRETPYRLLARKAGSLARAAWWLLQKLNALEMHMETVSTWTYVPHAQAPLHDAMLKAIDGNLRYVADGKAVFIIGAADFSELAGAPAFREMMRFHTGPFGINDPYMGRRIFDIPIHVVPNMTGMAVVPRVIIEGGSVSP